MANDRGIVQRPWIIMGYHEWIKRELAWRMRREMTACENILWQHVRARRLGGLKFRRQQVLFGFIADFYCHEACLVVEVDGDSHLSTQDYDAESARVLGHHGIRVLHIPNARIEANIYVVKAEILTAAKSDDEAGPESGTP